ncbi:MAG: cation-transporting P-type ATPase [Gemmataceae bacterium]
MTAATNGIPPSPNAGLSSDAADELLKQFGPNQPANNHGKHPLAELFGLFTNPLTLVLLVAAGVSAWVGDETVPRSSA